MVRQLAADQIRSEAHLAAFPAQDGVTHELLGVHLQLVGVLQRAVHAHVLNAILALSSAHDLSHNLTHTMVELGVGRRDFQNFIFRFA